MMEVTMYALCLYVFLLYVYIYIMHFVFVCVYLAVCKYSYTHITSNLRLEPRSHLKTIDRLCTVVKEKQ